MERELPLRIHVLRRPRGAAFAVQRGKGELVEPSAVSADAMVFDLTVRVAEGKDGRPNFLGPFAQGTPADRFVYLNSGTYAGQAETPWSRRAKLKLAGIGWEMVDEALATPGAVLEARIEGTAGDGGPCCATVPLLDGGWRVAR
ncbi:MAG TPA: DUF5990 family protein [Longimicrobiaceae bacterium]|nr:DUF5990 family protein [Longimicrobiaceae bacterium]